MPLIWTRSSTNSSYKITQNFSFTITLHEHTNYNLLRQHVVDRPCNWRKVNGQRYNNLPSSTARVCTEFKEIGIDTYSKNRPLNDDSRPINHDPVSTREESLKSSEEVSRTSSENTSVDFRIYRTNRLVVFNYSSSTSSKNKFQIPTATTNTNIKNTGVILPKSDSKQKPQERPAVMDTKLENLQWSFLDSVSQSSAVTNRCIQKGMGWSILRDINRRAMVKRGTVITYKCVGTESSKISTFDLQQIKFLKAIHFQIDNTTALLYLVKMGGTGNHFQWFDHFQQFQQLQQTSSLETACTNLNGNFA